MRNIALVHDWLVDMGGAEKVLGYLHRQYPDAPIYTSMCKREGLSELLDDAEIITSPLQRKLRGKRASHRNHLLQMPTAFERFDFQGYDVVLSTASACAKGILTPPETMHICYCHTPTRYAWDFFGAYTEELHGIKKRLFPYVMSAFRLWDYAAAQRVDHFIANSHNVARRIRKHYRREATVIHPPVDTERFVPSHGDDGFYLCVSRLVRYKRIDLAVEAFNRLGKPLVISGGGPEYETLRRMAHPNITFTGPLTTEEIVPMYQRCKGFVFPGEEDFGITPLEAQACGKPVIAFRKGGAMETVIEGRTGIFFDAQTVQAVMDAVEKCNALTWDFLACRENALRFSVPSFQNAMAAFVSERYEAYKKQETFAYEA